MDDRRHIREFLMSRRARLAPHAVGLPHAPGSRRVAGLRREEVAALAGVSVDYYTRLERGNASGVSDSVLNGICSALLLDAAERAHLRALLRGPGAVAHSRPPSVRASASVQRVLDSMTAPAFVSNSRLDLVATNGVCAALYADLDDHSGSVTNLARYTFLDPRAVRFYPEWDAIAEMTVALLRSSAGADPHDRELGDLIGELVGRSDAFRTRWSAHHVRRHTSGHKRIHHPVVGDLELAFDSMDLAVDPTLTITVYTAAPGSPSQDALRLLESWAAPGAVDVDAHRPAAGLPGGDGGGGGRWRARMPGAERRDEA